jgi:hypothetical protein
MPAIATGSHGEVGAFWSDGDSIELSLSHDYGYNWDAILQMSNTIAGKDLTDIIFYQNAISLAWTNWDSTGFRSIFFAKSDDAGRTWNYNYNIDGDSLEDSYDPAIAASKGKLYAIWYGNTNYPHNDSLGIYFSYWPYNFNSIDNGFTLPDNISFSSYPNPFNSSTTISFSNLQDAEIKIFDIKGALIKIIRIENKSAGSINWDGTDNDDRNITSGIYFARASGKNGSASTKLIYLK